MRRGGRTRLGRRLEIYTHPKYGGEVPIYLDKSGDFSAVIGDIVLTHRDLEKLRKLVDEALKGSHDLKWIPIIEISFGYRHHFHDDDRNEIHKENELKFTRYWIAKKIDKKWIKASWEETHYPEFRKKKVETGDLIARSQSFSISIYDRNLHQHIDVDFQLPYTEKDEDEDRPPTYYVNYEEGFWGALNELAKRFDILQENIVRILGSVDGRKAIAAQVQKLLPGR